MDIRYTHPRVAELWSDQWTFQQWLEIERCVLRAQREADPEFDGATVELWRWIQRVHIDQNATREIRRLERTETKHDVAALLAWLRVGAPQGSHIHYGLTSSDVVDTTQGLRFRELYGLFADAAGALIGNLSVWTDTDIPVAGRTHGQIGEPTSMKARAWHWLSTLEPALFAVLQATRAMQYAKLSGPMGTHAHNPPEIEAKVAVMLGLRPTGQGASQVIPRSALAIWANAASVFAAACSKIATDLRLMNMLGQATWEHAPGQVGSSAMPHKRNPIIAEQINGLAQLARGYASMLQPLDLWLERDISHSCVERVAIPDLWHTLLHTVKQTSWLLEHLHVNEGAIEIELNERANELWSHRAKLDYIRDDIPYDQAVAMANEHQVESYDVVGDARWWMRQYPGGKR